MVVVDPNIMWRVEGKRFTAGLKTNPEGMIVDAAPVLGQWRREQFAEFCGFAARQGWKVERVSRANAD